MAENPYDPPKVADYESGGGRHAPPEPSGVAKTMGVLSIIFGSLVALSNLWTLATASGRFRPRFGHPDPRDLAAAEELTRQIMPYSLTIEAMMLVMSIALIVIGAGLIKQRPGARSAAFYWSAAGFLVLGVRAWIFESKIWPRLQPFMENIMQHAMEKQGEHAKDMPFNPTAFAGAVGHATQYASLVILAIFPALMLLLLNLPSVKERLRGT